MKFNPKTALITLPILLARAGNSSVSKGSFKTDPTDKDRDGNILNDNQIDLEFYTSMEPTGKLIM